MRTKMREIELNGDAYEITRDVFQVFQYYSIGRCNVLVHPDGWHQEISGSRASLDDDVRDIRRAIAYGEYN